MGGLAGAIRGGLAGLNEAAGNPRVAQQLEAQNKAERDNRLQLQIAPLSASLRADMQRLTNYVDANGNPLPQHKADYDLVHERMANTIGQIRALYHQKPSVNPLEAGVGNLLDKLHITNHLKNHVASVRAENAKKYQDQNMAAAGAYAAGALPYSMTPEGQKEAYARQTAIDVAKVRGTMKEYTSPDGKERNWFRPGEEPSGWQAIESGGRGYIRQGSHVLLPSDAISLMKNGGQAFLKQDGTPWTADEISKFPQGIILAQFIEGDKTFYAPMDQRTKTATWGNMVHQINEAGEITPDTSTALGPQRVGTVSTQTAPGGGQVVTSTSTPVTPGAPKSQSAPSGPVQRKLRGTADVGRGKSILPDIQNMTPRNAAMAQKTQPAVTALLGLYGDPQNPSTPSMLEFSSLADDPHAQQVLGEAFKLLDQSMGEISDPGIIQTLGTAAGWANFRAQAEAGAQQATGTQMTPREREYFDSAIASMADIIGARSATGQSPARFSVRAIQNELPLIGLSGTPDEQSYLTKMQTIGRQVRVGLNAMPDNSRALAWLDRREQQISEQKEKPKGHQYAIDDQGRKRKVLDQNAKLPAGWKWSD